MHVALKPVARLQVMDEVATHGDRSPFAEPPPRKRRARADSEADALIHAGRSLCQRMVELDPGNSAHHI